MELLSTSTVHDPFSSPISSPSTRPFLAEVIDVGPNDSPGVMFDVAEKVHVAISTSIKKGEKLLRWTFRQFRCREVVLIHVHQPSTTIPTLLGNLPVKEANETSVAAHRRVEKEIMNRILQKYVNLCKSAKVKVSILPIENRNVHEGIVDLIGRHEIRKLVMGTVSDKRYFMKGRRNVNRAAYTAKNAPLFCEIWFVDKDKHVGTRQATTYPIPLEVDTPPTSSNYNTDDVLQSPSNIIASTRDEDVSGLTEVGVSREEPFTNVLSQSELESKAAEDIKKIKADDVAHALEINCMEELERDIWIARRQKEQLLNNNDETEEKLRKAKESIAFLEGRARELACVRDAKAGELKLVEDATASLNIERHIIWQQRDEARKQLEWWKSHDPSLPTCSVSSGFSYRLSDFAEFCLSDLQTATCDFSERFKIGQGGYGCVYKGELLDRTVAIKKLHPHYRQGQMEFQHEVHVLSRLNHPNLVSITGACIEAWSLVSDYMSNGSLQDQLLGRTKSTFQWTWKLRVRVAAEISSGLMYLHSSKPNKVIHGNLKPKNILFDSDFNCKISDFCISGLAPENTFYSPSFRRYSEFKGQFSYKDPEYERTGNLTPASDVYSFGIIVLQLLTGRPPEGLVNEVRQAMLGGKLSSVLDMTVGEWPIEVAFRLAEIGLHCCQMNYPDRLELTEMIVREFQQMHNLEEKPVPNYFLCPILQEVMQDPQVAADGFTYEGRALRNWLRNGRDTSPMTNLKLENLNLTPNHALRSAIQDWFRISD